MASSGPNSGGTFASDSTIVGDAWNFPSNAASSNDGYASKVVGAGGNTELLKCTNFGFAIPGGSTIDGILVEVERQGGCRDNSVRLYKAGSPSGSDKATATTWPGADAYASYGGAADLWGATWTVSDVNDSGFGAGVSALNNTGGAAGAYVDHVRITVYYTAGSSGGLGPVLSGKVTSEGRIFGGSVLRC